MNFASLEKLIDVVSNAYICCGQPDEHFVTMLQDRCRKGVIKCVSGDISATVDDFASVSLNGEVFTKTVRRATCEMICNVSKCSECKSYRPTLRAMHNRWIKRHRFESVDVNKHINDRYLSTPEKKTKMATLRKVATEKEKLMKKRVDQITEIISEEVDDELNKDVTSIIIKQSFRCN